MKYIKKFADLTINDVPLVGGKNASLGQMIKQLSKQGLRIPKGFAVTAEGYWYYLDYNALREPLNNIMAERTDKADFAQLKKAGKEIRNLIANGTMPDDLKQEIIQAYQQLCQEYEQSTLAVAVRSSATAEDLPEASFAGQQDTFLNIRGDEELIEACKKSMASLFTDRAIIYRENNGFDHFKVALSVGVQKMVRADVGSAGVLFTLDTETGFKDLVMIDAAFGLGEAVVKGLLNPDEFRVFKPTLQKGFAPIIKKKLGDKPIKIIYAHNDTDQKDEPIREVQTTKEEYNTFCLNDEEILELANAGCIIEDHYSEEKGRWMPMDVEWAKDGIDKKLYILQARPETIHALKKPDVLKRHSFANKTVQELEKYIIVTGESIGQQIVSGVARVAEHIDELKTFNEGDILITTMTDPDWVPIMKKAGAIVTDRGGRTSHAAIVSRELGISAIVGTQQATALIKDAQAVTVDCSQGSTGFIYDGRYEMVTKEYSLTQVPPSPVTLYVNIGNPDQAFINSFLPVDGVGLARLEFIITNSIKMHPMAAVEPEKIQDKAIIEQLNAITCAYPDYKTFFIDTLAQAIGTIAAAFYPRFVLVRLSDFKSNEYRNLLGGTYFEPKEENPMLGLRGASRYYSPLYEPAFLLECAALKKVRNQMGLDNMHIMIPFVRTTQEAQTVIDIMKTQQLQRHDNGLQLYMMCEVPSNVVLIDAFADYFDGISIGSNDLTQLVLAVDRDSALLKKIFDERDPAVKSMMAQAVQGAQQRNVKSGICGQAPSDYPEIAQFLIDLGIDSISLNVDSVMPFLHQYES